MDGNSEKIVLAPEQDTDEMRGEDQQPTTASGRDHRAIAGKILSWSQDKKCRKKNSLTGSVSVANEEPKTVSERCTR
jgi:hypothetical protein